ncbi:LTA synthase family protein [Paenibacillus sp. FSL R7-0313]|uniref:LTA synthase family protein n=1 Tax=Paenibacillus sp. FSL R7-0313 TaxID=2954532 RepID=UPI0030DDB3B5
MNYIKLLRIYLTTIVCLTGVILASPVDSSANYIGALDSPNAESGVFTDEMSVSGWALDTTGAEISQVNIYIDGQKQPDVQYGLSRGDLLVAFPDHKYAGTSGFSGSYSVSDLTMGEHTLEVRVLNSLGEETSVTQVQFSNQLNFQSGVLPTIVNKNGEKNLNLSGWVFTSRDIHEVKVFLDDSLMGNAKSGIQRRDVQQVFPDQSYAEYSGFDYTLNIENLETGYHTLKFMFVTDRGEEILFYEHNFEQKASFLKYYIGSILGLFLIAWIVIFIKFRQRIKDNVKVQLGIVLSLNIWFVASVVMKSLMFSQAIGHQTYIINILSTAAVLGLILLIASWIKNRYLRYSIIIFINVLMSFVIFTDIVYLRYFNDVTSIVMLDYVQQTTSLGDSIRELLKLEDILFFMDPLLVIGVLFFISHPPTKAITINTKLFKWVCGILAILFLTTHLTKIIHDDTNIYKQTFSNQEVASRLGIFNYHLYDLYQYANLLRNKPSLSTSQKSEIKDWFKEHKTYYPEQTYFGTAKGKNVILLQEESLQTFVVGLKVNGQEITPNLNKLLQEGYYFDEFYDQTYGGRTSDGELTALTSLYPLREGTINFRYPHTQVDTLPKIMLENGYSTFSAHAYKGSFWNRKAVHENYGFEVTNFEDDFELNDYVGWGLSDKEFFRQSVHKITDIQSPFFAFLISLSNHHPYDVVPESEKVLELGELEGTLMGNYLHSVHYADSAIGILVEELKDAQLYDNTMIAIYGDHDAGIPGEEILDLVESPVQINKLADKIPLILHVPSSDVIGKSELNSGHLDITPTLLHLLGVDPKEYLLMGSNLFGEELEDRVVPSRDGSFVTDGVVYSTNVCANLAAGQATDSNVCAPYLDEISKLFEISDTLIKTDIKIKLE